MNALQAELVERIRASGPLTLADYMTSALYDPEHGYYSGGGERTGWRGDFLTSPELDPAFGTLWARGIEEIWEMAGRPSSFEVVEVGPGEGGFAAALLDAAEGAFADALSLTLVEMSPERSARQVARLGEGIASWAQDVSEVAPLAEGCVFLNEVLDNQPVHALRVRDGEVLELHVAEDGGALVEMWRPCDDPSLTTRASEASVADTDTIEISPEAEDLARTCAGLVGRGAVIFIDYGRDGFRHTGDSLVTFSAAGVDALRLDDPGRRDITAHVDWSPIRGVLEETGFTTIGPLRQRHVLQVLGAAELDAGWSSRHRETLDEGKGAAAVRMLSRRHALRALLDPSGLGRLQVMAGIKGVAVPGFLHAKEEDRP